MVNNRFIVLVEPEIPENTGFIVRLCNNFDYNLRIVKPDFNLEECRNTASSSQQLLRDVEIFESLENAIEDLEFVVGTKPGKGVGLGEFEVKGYESLVLGRESRGLSNKELELCDAVVHVETGEFDSMNLSHAASVLMHSFHSRSLENPSSLSEDHRTFLDSYLGNKEVLKKLILRSNPDEREFNRLVGDLKKS